MENTNKNLRCIIIDDDNLSIDTLIEYVENVPGLMVEQIFQDPVLALRDINDGRKVDFIFLDVEMPNVSGLILAKELREHTRFLVFATGHNRYAIEAYNLHVDEYLLKPFSFAEFAIKIHDLIKKKRNINP